MVLLLAGCGKNGTSSPQSPSDESVTDQQEPSSSETEISSEDHAIPGTYTVPEGWEKSEKHSTDSQIFYIEEGHENDEKPDNISIHVGKNKYSLEEHEQFRDAIVQQILMQLDGIEAQLNGDGTYTEQGDLLYIFTIDEGDIVTTQMCIRDRCVFGGSSNTLDFLPLDRAGNRRFLPIMIYPENAEVHILEDEDASRAYLLQVWAEAMSIYHSGKYSMKFSKSIQRQLVEVQKDFMPEDTEAGQIQGFLEHYTGNMVCSKQLFKEALGHTFDEPKRWQLHNINEIMNTVVTGWKPFSNPRMFAGYGRQKGWERDTSGNELPSNEGGFVELSEEECRQLELPQEWIA